MFPFNYKVQIGDRVFEVSAFSEETALILAKGEAIDEGLSEWNEAFIVKEQSYSYNKHIIEQGESVL